MATVIGKNPRLINQTSCRECASIIEYTASELKSYSYKDYGGFSNTDYILICPCCGHDIDISA